jgi:hypothetical protein
MFPLWAPKRERADIPTQEGTREVFVDERHTGPPAAHVGSGAMGEAPAAGASHPSDSAGSDKEYYGALRQPSVRTISVPDRCAYASARVRHCRPSLAGTAACRRPGDGLGKAMPRFPAAGRVSEGGVKW